MRGHIITVRHQIFPDGKKNGDTDDPDQCLYRIEMFHDHLPCCCKKQDFDNSLGGMAAEHFYKLHTDYKGQCLRQETGKKAGVHIHDGGTGSCKDQSESGQCDHDNDHDG